MERAKTEKKVVIVEDEVRVRRFIWDALSNAGYDVMQAGSGEEMKWLLEAPGRNVDLLVADVVMPGMSGPDFARWLKETHPITKVLFITGYPEDTARQFGLPLGGFELLQKPFGVDVLLRRVESILGTGPGAGSAGVVATSLPGPMP